RGRGWGAPGAARKGRLAAPAPGPLWLNTPPTNTCAPEKASEPVMMLNRPAGHLLALAQASNAPWPPTVQQGSAVTLPSFVQAISVCMWKSRANAVVDRFSMRSSVHFTGRPVTIEATMEQI